MSFVDFLTSNGVLKQNIADKVNKELAKDTSASLEKVLQNNGLKSNEILQARGEYLNVPIKKIGKKSISFDILKNIPEDAAIHYKFAPLAITEGFLEVGMVNPDDLEAKDALNFISAKVDIPLKVFLISEEDLDNIVNTYKGLSGEVTKALGELETSMDVEEELAEPKKKGKKEETRIIEDAPVTKIVATILRYAVEGKASDVHIEPMADKVRVRFRVDGIMHISLILPPKVLSSVVARIKILSQMKLDEKRKPQDGRFSAKIEGRKIDFRVSTFPSYYGEKVVMRILDQDKGVKALDEIGLSDRNFKLIMEAVKRPYGLILISGPTGSGKTTTLYSIMKSIDKDKYNVLSLEDPVEYSVPGVSQSQIRPEIGYTFANGLRTTLRQDPDIIMVGEIRDGETAKLAIQAALTGHLVLSTIHTNTAAGIVPRLIDMGVDPYLIPPTLILGMAQRLVKKICPGTGEVISIDGGIREMLNKQFADLPEEFRKEIPNATEFLKIKPTPTCPAGTSGREAVFEIFKMNKEIEKVILENPIESAVYDIARKNGMLTMKEDAIIKAMDKQIPFEEINTL